MDNLGQDFRYGARMLAKRPGFTAVAVLTLALGIGANSALFSVVNAVMLREFPYGEPERLVVVWETQMRESQRFMFASPPNYQDWRAQQTVFDDLAAFAPRSFFLTQDDEQARVQGAQVTASLFPLLQVKPHLGRMFLPEEDKAASNRVALIGFGLWQSGFGSDRNVIGRSVLINEEPHTVIGVMPPELNFPPPIDLEGNQLPQRNELWLPVDFTQLTDNRGAHFIRVIARLKSGITIERANAEMTAIAQRLAQQYPETNSNWNNITLVPLTRQVLGDVQSALWVLLGAVGCVLLVACVNVANMMLARSAARQKEFAIRVALGSGRWRLMRQLLTESLTLALLGGAVGMLLAYWGMKLIVSLAPQHIPRLDEASVDLAVVGFTLLISLLTGVMFGIVPALRSFTRKLYGWLKEGGRTSSDAGGTLWVRDLLVIAEIALSFTLLVGASLLLQSFLRLRGVDTGFQSDNVLTMRLRLPQTKYQQPAHRVAFVSELEQRLKAMPQVGSAGLTTHIPIGSDWEGTGFTIEGEPPLTPEQQRIINWTLVTPGFCRTMGITILRGRDFTEQDSAGAPGVALINETLARRYFPDQDPLGKRIFAGFSSQKPSQIIGIVKDIKHSDLQSASTAHIYAPYYQLANAGTLSLVLRSSVPAATLIGPVRDTVRSIERGTTTYEVKTLEQVVADSIALPRFSMLLSGLFAATALLLAMVGIYGVVSYTVSQHTHEIGVRMALGAQPRDILKLILGHGLRPAAIGIVLGLGAAFALTRLMSNLLFEVSATNPVIFALIALLVVGVTVLASYLPARRATKVDPLVALRYE